MPKREWKRPKSIIVLNAYISCAFFVEVHCAGDVPLHLVACVATEEFFRNNKNSNDEKCVTLAGLLWGGIRLCA